MKGNELSPSPEDNFYVMALYHTSEPLGVGATVVTRASRNLWSEKLGC